MPSLFKKVNTYEEAYKASQAEIERLKQQLAHKDQTISDIIGAGQARLEVLRAWSRGDFDVALTQSDPQAEGFRVVFEDMQQSLQQMMAEVKRVAKAVSSGDFNYRVDTSHYTGDWKILGNGLADVLAQVAAPVADGQRVIAAMAGGDLSQRMGTHTGEFGKLADVVNGLGDYLSGYVNELSVTMARVGQANTGQGLAQLENLRTGVDNTMATLSQVVKDMTKTGGEISTVMNTVANHSMTVFEGIIQENLEIKKLTETTEWILDLAKETAERRATSNALMEQVRDSAVVGSDSMKEMLTDMENINKASGEISKIIKVIDDIAFQTNLLALNAAVEAARAGEHGRGFAVVAEEVRNLATKSKQSAAGVAEVIERSGQLTKHGSATAEKTSTILEKMLTQLEEAEALTGSLAARNANQLDGIRSIGSSTKEISDVVMSLADTSKQNSAAIEQMTRELALFLERVKAIKVA